MRCAFRSLVAALVFMVAGSAALAQNRVIYPDPAQAQADVAHAIQTATREHKRIILDFGGNWCPDCHVLYIYLHQSPNAEIVRQHFVVVSINVGRFDKNVKLAEKYKIPLKKGVPALAVLDSHGRLLYSQKNGQFEAMRSMNPQSVTTFLNQWK